VIRLDLPPDTSWAERWALETLVDLSRLLPCERVEEGTILIRIGAGDGVQTMDGAVVVGRSMLARVVAVAGAGAEQDSRAADKHGRVPPSEHPLVESGTERTPVVQRLAADLRRAVISAAGRRPVRCVAPWPDGHRWAVAMTHDVDVVAGWPIFTIARLAELTRRGRVADAARVSAAAMGAVLGAPVASALRAVLEAERRHGIPSTWFMLVGDPTLGRWRRGDVTYRIESRPARTLLDEIIADGHEVGLHGSMETGVDQERFAEERGRLARVIGSDPRGVRQHFLKMRPGATQRAMRGAGFDYDATYGFSDRNGFRLGVTDMVTGWDQERSAPTPLDEVPLHWMDRALSKYQGVEDPDALVADGLALAEIAQAEQGLWVGLWHPNLAPALGYPGAPEAFARMLSALADRGPWMARLTDVIEWRRLRRAARVRQVAPDGRIELAASAPSAWTVSIEDADGRKVA
jgi:peptidoglycan/xylan/chitin deacetylase (PgdA/CDA1 family)